MSVYFRRMQPITSGSWAKVARKTYQHEAGLVVRFDDNRWGWEIIGASRFDGYLYGTLWAAQMAATS